jgi:hypothetical protein
VGRDVRVYLGNDSGLSSSGKSVNSQVKMEYLPNTA